MKFSCDLSGNAIPRPSTYRSFVRTRSVTAPSDGGIVTREEYEALLARVIALESVTRNVTPPPQAAVTRNASNADRQRRYRQRLKDRAATG